MNNRRHRPQQHQQQQQHGINIPGEILKQISANAEENQDDRKFKRFRIGAARKRKETRKEKKNAKRQPPTQSRSKKRKHFESMNEDAPEPKKPKTSTLPTPDPKKTEKSSSKLDTKTNSVTDAQRMERLSKKNPEFYSLLQSAQLVTSLTGTAAEDKEERELRAFERKLGIKRGSAGLSKAFQDDGLDFLLDGLDVGSRKLREKHASLNNEETLSKKKVPSKDKAKEEKDMDGESESEEEISGESMDELDTSDGGELDDGDEDGDEGEDEDEDEEDEVDDEDEDEDEDDDVSDGEDEDEDDGEESEDIKQHKEQKTAAATTSEDVVETEKQDIYGRSVSQPTIAGKYIPPHLRGSATTKSEQQIRLQRQLQGLFNRLTEGNIESILVDVEKLYRENPRNDVTTTISDIILATVSARSNLLDSFVIQYAAFVAALFRIIGTEFAAHLVQTMVEMFEKHKADALKGELLVGTADIKGSKEANNLALLLAELYNFQVVASVLVYDLVKTVVADLSEVNVEILLKLIRASGHKLRQDDPAALKDVIMLINKETAKHDKATLSSRTKFMLECISNLKNNKTKTPNTLAGTAAETAAKMKKFLSGLEKKRQTLSTGALRVSLSDIHSIATKGKWWLVGASWVGRDPASASSALNPEAAKEEAKANESLLKLAKAQKMNTDVRRNIFVVLMSSEDYADAFEKLAKLNLTEVQEREIIRVLLHCCGNERTHNPYYTHLAARLCRQKHSYRVTLQYSLWDFMRELGEKDIGGLESAASRASLSAPTQAVPVRRSLNIARLYARLVASADLGLVVLKTLSFERLGAPARLFLQCFFATLFDVCAQENSSGVYETSAKSARDPVETAVGAVFSRCAAAHPATAQGCLLFLYHYVRPGNHFVKGEKETKVAKRLCSVAKEAVRRTAVTGGGMGMGMGMGVSAFG